MEFIPVNIGTSIPPTPPSATKIEKNNNRCDLGEPLPEQCGQVGLRALLPAAPEKAEPADCIHWIYSV